MRIIEIGGVYNINGSKHFGRKKFIPLNEVESVKKKFNNTDVYSTVFTYDSEDQNASTLYGPMYLDLDMEFNSEEEYRRLKTDLVLIVNSLINKYKIPKERMMFYFTGKKGFHILIPQTVFGLPLIKDTNVYYKIIAQDLQKSTVHNPIDIRIYDNKRLFRLPNTINSKSGLYKVPITFEQAAGFSYEEMKEYASSPKSYAEKIDTSLIKEAAVVFQKIMTDYKTEYENRRRKRIEKKVDVSKVKLAKCINRIILEGVNEGSRNNTAVILASALFQKGIIEEQVIDIVLQWNESMVSPPIEHGELMNTINSARNMVDCGRGYGCSSIADLGFCSNECKFSKGR